MRGPLLGAVLAGGASRRFGADKAWALLDGEPLILHAARSLEAHSDAVVTCGRALEGYACLADLPAPGLGPLGGLCAALHHGLERGFAAVLTTGCDIPRLPDAAVKLLLAEDGAAFVAGMPIVGLWPTAAAPELLRLLTGEDRSMRAFGAALGAVAVKSPEVIPNVNRPADLEALRR